MGNQGTVELPQEELSAREIFKRILAGQTVRIPYDIGLKDQLYNHLHVIKSREKKLFRSLGLDFTSAVVNFTPKYVTLTKPGTAIVHHSNVIGSWEISLSAPKMRRKYATFSIASGPNAGDNNSVASSTPTTSTA